jgi:thiosulfate dehydrogenase
VIDLLDATNQCITQFMRGRALAPDDDNGRALFVYLESLSPDASAAGLPLTTVRTIVDVPSGDAGRGSSVYAQACAGCHGAPHTAQGRIASDATIVPDDSIAAHGSDPKTGARPIVIEKVRHGKFFGIGGVMPSFSLEALSDAELGDLLAYLEAFGLPK